MLTQEVEHCRACGFHGLTEVMYLGHLALAGTFPPAGVSAETALISLGICGRCHLLQLQHSYDDPTLFERDYGYRSSLNGSMKAHIESVVQDLLERFPLRPGDTVVDIGANDGTLLKSLPAGLRQIAIDPGMDRYRHYYAEHSIPRFLHLAKGYFPRVQIPCLLGQARLVTSLAVFYDVQHPRDFMEAIRDLLAPDGIWYNEQVYIGTVIDKLDYSTICHEHAGYYGLSQFHMLAELSGLKIIDVSFNPTNGGSIGVVFARADSQYESAAELPMLLAKEARFYTKTELEVFKLRVLQRTRELHTLIERLVTQEKRTVVALGASTKGNIILQLSNLGFYVRAVGDINPDKYGCTTPGSKIPIVPEDVAMALNPDYILILPYHFRDGFIERTKDYVASGGKLIFPLPDLEVYPA